jgi:hypothetical protein
MNASANLLLCLHRWAARQDENFLTEAFVHLLRHLLEYERALAVELLADITAGRMQVAAKEADFVAVSTQVVIAEGRPDVEISAPNQLVFIEAKKESGLGTTQLSRYLKELKRRNVPCSTLVLLTRYHQELEEDEAKEVVRKRWHQIGEWCEDAIRKPLTHPASGYLIGQFVDYLKGKGMLMEQVTWELSRGVQALYNLLAMVNEAIVATGVQAKKTQEKLWHGYYLDEGKFTFGLSLDEPTLLYMRTWALPLDPKKAEKVEIGEIIASDYPNETGPIRWVNCLNLESEEVHFFARSKASQLQCIEQFIAQSIQYGKTLQA